MGNVLSCIFDKCDDLMEKCYPKQKWLQPRYVASTLMVSSLGYTLYKNPGKVCCPKVANFAFLSSTGATLGLQFWVFFNSGITMMRLLPRHQFGLVQSHLYSKFFFLTSVFNFTSLSVFLKSNPLPLADSKYALGACLSASFVLNIINLTCFNPNSIKYNQKMHEIEKASGEGLTTIGPLEKDNQCESNTEYVEARKKFYRHHGYSALSGLVSFGCTVAEFYFLSDKSFFKI